MSASLTETPARNAAAGARGAATLKLCGDDSRRLIPSRSRDVIAKNISSTFGNQRLPCGLLLGLFLFPGLFLLAVQTACVSVYDPPQCGINPQLSPDASKVAFTAPGTDGDGDLFIYDIASQEVHQLTKERFRDSSPAWAPDGESLYYISRRGLKSVVMRISIDNLHSEKIASRRSLLTTAMPSPDGQTLAVGEIKEVQGRMRRIFLLEKERFTQLSTEGIMPCVLDWLENDLLAYAATRYAPGNSTEEIFSVDVFTGETKSAWKSTRYVGNPIISRDGKRVVWIENYNWKLWRIVVEERPSARRWVLLERDSQVWDMDLSNDGRWLVFLIDIKKHEKAESGTLCLADLEAGTIRRLMDTGTHTVVDDVLTTTTRSEQGDISEIGKTSGN